MKTSYNLDSCNSSSLHTFTAQKQSLCIGTNESYYRSFSNVSGARNTGIDLIRSKAIACQNTFAPANNNVTSIQEEEMEDISVASSNSPCLDQQTAVGTGRNAREQSEDCNQFSRFFRHQEEQQRPSASLKSISNEETYSDRVIASMRENQRMPSQFLAKHTIAPEVRAKMVDWMVEVTSSYGCSDQTFFLSVAYMDQYFEKSQKVLTPQDLHLTGVASMFIACKYEEIYPLHLQTFYEKIGHKKLSKEDIKRREQDILHAINFDLSAPTIHDFIVVTVKKLNLEKILEPMALTFFTKMCSYLSKLSCHEYSISTQFTHATIAGAIIYVSFKILQQMNSNFDLVSIIQQVIGHLQLDNEDILKSSTHMLSLARNFERCYPNLVNLKKTCADIQSLGPAAAAAPAPLQRIN